MADRPRSRSSKPKKKVHRVEDKRTLSPEAVERLLAWATGVIDAREAEGADQVQVRDAFIAVVLLGTGARRFELCGLRCGDIASGAGGPTVYFDGGKGNKDAYVPISEATYATVELWKHHKTILAEPTAGGSPLFCGRPGEFMSPATLNLAWDRILRDAGLPKIRGIGVHVTRHAAGMMVLRASRSLSVTAEFLRHESEAVTAKFYKHVLPGDVRSSLDKAKL